MSRPYPTYTYSYTTGPPVIPARRTGTSSTELVHLVIASAVLTLDFVLILWYSGGYSISREAVPVVVGISASAAITGFVAHEMAHKLSAQLRGYWAEFRFAPLWLLLSVITAAAGFLFAAPGATMIGGMANVRDWGRTSLAGPAMNFVFALAFLGGAIATTSASGVSFLPGALLFLSFINGWFAAFNMIPFGPLDGAKVFRWNRSVWVLSFGVFAALAGVLFYLSRFGAIPHF